MRTDDPLSGTPAQRAIAANVRVELARANVSAAEMARRISIPQATFARRMTAEVSFAAEELASVAAELGISVEVLLAGAVGAVAADAVAAS
jgi:hypothetical protein